MRLCRWKFKRTAWVCKPHRKPDDGWDGRRDALADDLKLVIGNQSGP